MIRFRTKNDTIQGMHPNNERQKQIIHFLWNAPQPLTTNEIIREVSKKIRVSEITLKRDLSELVDVGVLIRIGQARATRYSLHPQYFITAEMDIEEYFQQEVDERPALESFQFDIFQKLQKIPVFLPAEEKELMNLLKEHQKQKSKLSPQLLKREFERLTIELSWKSSAIEGNTYSLLETESLLKDGVRASGKKKEDAIMLLNHKHTLDFIRENEQDYRKLTIPLAEEVHRLLIRDLDVSPQLRKNLVSITGTKYRPLDNEFQIREALQKTCDFINQKKNALEKAFWAILLISYIQPFEDGNKRTSRMISTALLLAGKAIPLSYRSVKIDEYKKAILLFYELNNISAFKKIFMEQIRFAVKNYFRVKS